MSSSLAIAAVTATLHRLLDQGLNIDVSGTSVTTRPPDKARTGVNGSQVNLFLYHAMLNGAWRNMNIPWRVKPGETGHPPLPLNLYYLVTAYYGDNEDGIDMAANADHLLGNHRLLGRAMSILHNHPVLDPSDINAILPPGDQLEHLYDKVERIRITSNPLSLDDMSKLWASFQTQYRMSTTYEVSVVLIESAQPTTAALPVLQRGSDDRGSYVLPSLSPILFELLMPNRKPSAELGDILTIVGDQLDSGDLTVRFNNALLVKPIECSPMPGGIATQLQVKLPDTADDVAVPSKWPSGFYTLSLIVRHPDLPPWATNELSFALSPWVISLDPPVATQANLPLTLTLTCTPQIRSQQRVVLLFGNREIPAQAVTTPDDPTAPSTLTFIVKKAEPGEYIVRVRVDGIDSVPVDFSTAIPQFAPNQKVTIT